MSYGFRRGRPVPHAVAEIQRHREEGYQWVVDADIDDFFHMVDPSHLLSRLRESIQDPDLLQLVHAWLTAPVQDGSQLIKRSRGLPRALPFPLSWPISTWTALTRRSSRRG